MNWHRQRTPANKDRPCLQAARVAETVQSPGPHSRCHRHVAIPAIDARRDLPSLRLIVADDSPLDFELLVATLEREHLQIAARRVETGPQLIAALTTASWDAVISEHRLPAFSSGEALRIVREGGHDLPFIIVSGTIGEEAAVAAMRSGVDDYLTKGRLARLAPALLNALSAAETRRQRARDAQALEASEERLRGLLAHLETVVDEERTAIAREIHDDIGGMLTALRFDLSWIERNGDARSVERAGHAMHTIAQVMQSAQHIQRNLRPPVLDAGLLEAMRWQIGEFRRRTGTEVDFTSNVTTIVLDAEPAMCVYRTLQEALTNVAKHARARSVRVGLIVEPDQLSLEIADDGIGMDQRELAKPASFGLRGLAERARRSGGWIDVSAASRGTCVLLSIPIAQTTALESGATQ